MLVTVDETIFYSKGKDKARWLFKIPNNKKEILFKLSEEYNPDFNWDGRIDGVKGVPVGGEGSPGKTINLTESSTPSYSFSNSKS